MSEFIHRFEPGAQLDGKTLLLLHGTGGDENSLIQLGRSVVDWNLLSPRGKVLENGMPRFFRRLREGVFDEDDVKTRADELAEFITESAQKYGFDAANIWALGYSNGANIAAALMMRHPNLLRGAVLWRAMMPLQSSEPTKLNGTKVLLCAGEFDPIVPRGSVQTLADYLTANGAEISLQWQSGGHELHSEDIDLARVFLNQ
jgi:predicted esterase